MHGANPSRHVYISFTRLQGGPGVAGRSEGRLMAVLNGNILPGGRRCRPAIQVVSKWARTQQGR